MAKFVTDRKLWLTADRERVVEDGDPAAAFLLASAGKELDAETVEKYGLKAAKPAEDKGGKQVANKEAKSAENKGIGKGGE